MEKIVEKASTLIEALPYIRKFREKEIVIKYGGATMNTPEVWENVLHDLVFMNYVGIRPILVHGGGSAITENLKKRGIQSRFVKGLRVTDRETVRVVADTLEEINQKIVRDIRRFGGEAVGIVGHRAKILKVLKYEAEGDVGFVGEVRAVNFRPIRKLTRKNIIPVVAPLGIDKNKELYNVNADEAAAKIGSAMQVQKLMVLTNVLGIFRDPQDKETLMPSLHVKEVEELIQRKVITDGMIPKVYACITALQAGVKKAHVVDGRILHSLLLEIFTDKGIGTEIVL